MVTKDHDFNDASRFPGPPPKVLHVALGNGSTAAIESALRSSVASILDFDRDATRLLVLDGPGANDSTD